MTRSIILLLTLALPLTLHAAGLPQWTFEQGLEGWISLDRQATLTRSTDPAHVHTGQGSLQFSFPAHGQEPGEIPGALAANVTSLDGAEAVHLAIQTSVAGPVVIALLEQDDSNYMLFSYLTANDWHVLDLPIAAFQLDENSTDENDVLDTDQVVSLAFADPGHWLSEAVARGGFPFFYERPSRRDFWLDDIRLLADVPPRLAVPQLPGTVMLEDCDSDTAYFTILGGRNLQVMACPDPAVRGQSLRLDYELPEKTLLAVVRPLPRGTLQGARGLSFSVRSGAKTVLLVSVEEHDRSRYNTVVEVAPTTWQTPIVLWSALRLADDSHDEDEGLQPEKIWSVMFADVTALLANKETANTLWLDEITTAP
jgi:hypothetical protein